MTEVALKKLEDQLNCLVCLDTYTDPKQLQCHHVFCHKCLVPLVIRDQQGQLTLTCPTCRQVTPVPTNGVIGLKSAFQINHLLEIVDEHKKAKASATAQKVESDSSSLVPQGKVIICCREHAGKEVDAYCASCEEPVCMKCVIKSGKHYGHDTELLNEGFEQYKKEISLSLEPMEKQLTTIKKALTELDTRCEEVSDQQAKVEADIHHTFKQLHDTLDIRKADLISQLDKITQRKLKSLAIQKDQTETMLAQLSSCLGFMKESLETDSEAEVLMMKRSMVKQVKELNNTFRLETLKPNTEADTIFSAVQDFITLCQNYGDVLVPSFVDPSKCHTTSKGLETAMVGKKSTAVLQAVNFRGQPCEQPVMSSECELVSEIMGTRVRGSVERKGESQYEISYMPTIKGRHQLHVKVEGQHIIGSPFSVVTKFDVKKISTPVRTLHGFEGPLSLAFTNGGEMVVSNWYSHCVSVFSPNGDILQSFGSHGSGQGQFDSPCSVAVDNMGNIIVADYRNDRIQKLTPEGKFLTVVYIKGGARPIAITFNSKKSRLYVVDSDCSVHVLNSDLTYNTSFGKRGSGKGQLMKPNFIACDSVGNVYVADQGHSRIQVFTEEGKFLRTFGRHGQGRGELAEPCGIAIDADNNMVYVSERANHRVSVFTSEGQFVAFFGKHGSGPGEFDKPRGMAIDSDGVLYVCDYRNNRIQLF